jgi:hypothetical protein
MFFLSDLSTFKKQQDEEKKPNRTIQKVKGITLLGGSGIVGTQAVRSGLPRLVGARLEQHGTSRKAAANIIKEGYLDPAYGGAESGVTASMKLPKEFMDRAKGYTFISGKNPNHPFWNERNPLSPIWDVINRKIQVLGYRGSKAGKLTDKDIEKGAKFIGGTLSSLLNPLEKKLNEMTPEKYLEDLKYQAEKGGNFYRRRYERLRNNPDELNDEIRRSQKEIKKSIKKIKDIAKRGYKDPGRIKAINTTQLNYKKLFDEYKNEFKEYAKNEDNIRKVIDGDTGKLLKQRSYKRTLTGFLSNKANDGDKKAARLLKLQESLEDQLGTQKTSKILGLGAGWTQKLISSPALGAVGVGKTLYIPGTDDYFNNTERFQYDIDDPFGNPLKIDKAFQSEQGGFGGNALKTKEKVRAFGNRFAATKYLLEQEGGGNLFKGAGKLIAANPKRALAGAAILGLGGAGSYMLGKKGINLIKGGQPDKLRDRKSKVKSYVRKGKLVKGFERLNPFYNKNKVKRRKSN